MIVIEILKMIVILINFMKQKKSLINN